ncbi:MAG TPA: alpha/beta fold hydrolase [Candidatus Nitrosopolaris sp.]|nr:alpha/beta fold hydrolase [Candidatus Nitrosopolaris sp.]
MVRVLEDVLLAVVVGSVLFNVLAYGSAALVHRRQANPAPLDDVEPVPWPASLLAGLSAFGRECAATALLTLTLPLSLRRLRVRALEGGNPCRPVILLHGYGQHTANFLWLGRQLRRDGWLHLYSVRHTPVGGDIGRSAARLGRAIERIRRESCATEVDIIAHSMGGLVARAFICQAGAASGVARLITLGTPHQGTEVLRSLGRDPMIGQMRPGSPFLSQLAATDTAPETVDCTSIYSADDAIVAPPANAYYPGAHNIEVRGLGHMSLLFSRRVYELVRENLGAELPSRSASAPSASAR